MDYLQYYVVIELPEELKKVLNLIINGLPSIRRKLHSYRKWFNEVLNLIINGLPSIHDYIKIGISTLTVLNLIINGLPSILRYWTRHYVHKSY